jgi:hypothetical protein
VPALVVRSTRECAGLMFRDFNLGAFHALLTQLLAEGNPAHPVPPENARADTPGCPPTTCERDAPTRNHRCSGRPGVVHRCLPVKTTAGLWPPP